MNTIELLTWNERNRRAREHYYQHRAREERRQAPCIVCLQHRTNNPDAICSVCHRIDPLRLCGICRIIHTRRLSGVCKGCDI